MNKTKKIINKITSAVMKGARLDLLMEALSVESVTDCGSLLFARFKEINEALNKSSYPNARKPYWLRSVDNLNESIEYLSSIERSQSCRVVPKPIMSTIEECFGVLLAGGESAPIAKLSDYVGQAKDYPLGKFVNGAVLSSECFAITPNESDPNTWEAQILDESGKFIECDLTNSFVGMTSENFKQVKEKYNEAKLKNTGRALVESFTLLAESDVSKISKGRLKITIIAPGLTVDRRRFYPKQALAEALGLYEGAKMYMNHATAEEDWQRPERSVDDWIGSIEGVHLGESGEILATAVIIDPDFKSKVELLNERGKLAELGISQSVVGEFDFEEIDGEDVMVVNKIIAVRSVDFVTEGNAGGAVDMLESLHEKDLDLVSLTQLEESRPDLINQLKEKHKTNMEESSMNWEKIANDLKTQLAAVDESNKTEMKTLQTALDEALAQIEKSNSEKELISAQESIKADVEASGLPDNAKEHIMSMFKESSDYGSIKESLTGQISIMSDLSKTKAKVTGLGESSTPSEDAEDVESGKSELIESYATTFQKRDGLDVDEAKAKAERKYQQTH